MTVGPIVHDQWREYVALEKRLRELEKQQRKDAANTENWDFDQYRVSCTCPPSTSICVRGGRQWSPPSDGGWMNPGLDECSDITDDDFVFTNADWYTDRLILIDWFNTIVRFDGSGEEYETAAEAEQAAMLDFVDYARAGIWVEVLILRNNGITGTEGQYRVVEPVNRGNSYVWREARGINWL